MTSAVADAPERVADPPDPLAPHVPDNLAAPATVGAELAPRQPMTLRQKLVYADRLSKSRLLPQEFRQQEANVLFAIEYASMLNLHPMAAITGIHVIDGKPTASAALMSALVRREGHKLRVRFDPETSTATATLIRHDDPDHPFVVMWDLKRAVRAQLCTLDKNGDAYARDSKNRPLSWEKYTPNMLKWRCISEVCRDGAEECLMGMHYTPEEMGVDVDEDGNIVMEGEVVTPSAPVGPPIDWETEIAACGDDADKWLALWRRTPQDSEIRDRVRALGVEAAARRKAAAEAAAAAAKPAEPTAAAPDPDGAVEAEIVEDPTTGTLEDVAAKVFEALITCAGLDDIDNTIRLWIHGYPVAEFEVMGMLTDDDREVLGFRPADDAIGDDPLTLESFAALVLGYVKRRGCAVRDALTPTPTAGDTQHAVLLALAWNFDEEGKPTGPWSDEQWEDAIAQAVIDRDADRLGELHDMSVAARPLDYEMQEKIAGLLAAEAPETPEVPDSPAVPEAPEAVQEPSGGPVQEIALRLLNAGSKDEVIACVDAIREAEVGKEDVFPFLTADDLGVLGIGPNVVSMKLVTLAARVGQYVGKHHAAPRGILTDSHPMEGE